MNPLLNSALDSQLAAADALARQQQELSQALERSQPAAAKPSPSGMPSIPGFPSALMYPGLAGPMLTNPRALGVPPAAMGMPDIPAAAMFAPQLAAAYGFLPPQLSALSAAAGAAEHDKRLLENLVSPHNQLLAQTYQNYVRNLYMASAGYDPAVTSASESNAASAAAAAAAATSRLLGKHQPPPSSVLPGFHGYPPDLILKYQEALQQQEAAAAAHKEAAAAAAASESIPKSEAPSSAHHSPSQPVFPLPQYAAYLGNGILPSYAAAPKSDSPDKKHHPSLGRPEHHHPSENSHDGRNGKEDPSKLLRNNGVSSVSEFEALRKLAQR